MPQKNRIQAIDYFRGLVMAGVIINHLLLFPSVFELFTGRALGWYSDAEAFFLLSGVTMGVVRGGGAARAGLRSILGKVGRRAAKLYIWSIGLSVAFVLIAREVLINSGLLLKGGLDTDTGWLLLLWKIITLQYAYGWSDFLIYYVPFLLVSPLLIYAMLRWRRAWIAVCAASLALFGVMQLAHGGVYHYFGIWQAYFVLGLVFGLYLEQVKSLWHGLGGATRSVLAYGSVMAAAILYVASQVFTFVPTFFAKRPELIANDTMQSVVTWVTATEAQLEPLMQSNRTGVLRLLVTLVLLAGLLAVYVRFEPTILRYSGWLFSRLGRHSLHVFVLQAIILFFVPLLGLPQSFASNTVVTALFLMLFWLLVRYRVFFKILPS